jgi:hypothetical protein
MEIGDPMRMAYGSMYLSLFFISQVRADEVDDLVRVELKR